MLHLKCLEKQEQAKPKIIRREKNNNKGWNQWNRNQTKQNKKPHKESTKQKAGFW
jgi:hypothetical protein